MGKNLFKMAITALCILHACIAWLIWPMTAYSADNSKLVRVGYVNVPSYEEGGEGEYKTGYGYEFLQKISYQTGWKYVYVYGSFNDLYSKLVKGEIDLMGDISYTPERAKLMNFSSYPMAKDNYYLYCLPTSKEYMSGDTGILSGKKIGVTANSYQEKLLRAWLAKYNIQADILYFKGYDDMMAELDKGDIDLIATPRLATGRYPYAIVADIGYSDTYFVVAKDRTDLLSSLEKALYKIHSAELNYGAALQHKYQKGLLSDTFLYAQETAWLDAHNWTVRVGYLEANRPYSYRDDDGSFSGVMAELLQTMATNLGIKFEVKNYHSNENLYKALLNGEVDVIGPWYGDVWLTEQDNLIQTDAALTTSAVLVRKNVNDAKEPERIAVSRNSFIRKEAVRVLYPDAALWMCDSLEEAVDLVAAGKVDAMIVAASQTNILKRFPKADNFSMTNLSKGVEVCLGLTKDNVELANIFNKGIVSAERNMETRVLEESTVVNRKAGLDDFIKDNIVIVTFLLVLLVAALIKYVAEKNEAAAKLQKNKRKLQNANEQLTAMNQELQAQHHELQTSYEHQQEQNQILYKLNRDLEEKEQAVQKASNAKSMFLFNMSHDIRTPMNAIIGFAELLKDKDITEEKRDDYIAKILDSGKFLSTLINNVLDMARIESGKMELNEKVHRLGCITKMMKSAFSDQMRKKNQEFNVVIDVWTQYAWFDATKVQQVLFNILSNASKYTPEGGRVSLTLKELPSDREGYCKIHVIIEDTGRGMSPEYLPHIFEDFSRERNTTEGNVIGTGLGLPIVKSLLDFLGGKIDVESEVGKGSRFTVTLWYRIADTPDELTDERVEKKPDISTLSGKRILFVEDNDLNAEIAMTLLEKSGLLAERAEDGAICLDMLEKAQDGHYDLVLMDIQMPNMDGYTATRRIRQMQDKAKAAIPVVAMTANAFDEDRKKAFEAGMDAHVAKPINVNELLNVLLRMLGKNAK